MVTDDQRIKTWELIKELYNDLAKQLQDGEDTREKRTIELCLISMENMLPMYHFWVLSKTFHKPEEQEGDSNNEQ